MNSPIFTGTKKARTKGPGFSVEFADQSTPGRRSKRTQKNQKQFLRITFFVSSLLTTLG